MYCSINIVKSALVRVNKCDESKCDGCKYHCIDKAQIISSVYFIIQELNLTIKEVEKVNGYIKMLE